MDERKLAELFNDAVRDAPPASFGAGDVRQASYRAASNRRTMVVAASVLGIVLLGGGLVSTVALSSGKSTSSASPVAVGGSADAGRSGTMDNEGKGAPAPQVQNAPETDNRSEAPKQGGPLSGTAGSSAGDTPRGCEKADRELAAALASELPAAANAKKGAEFPVPFGCPTGSRGAAFKVTDGPRAGTISVVLVPKGVSPGIAPMGIGVPGTMNFNAPAQSGGTVYIVSQPTPELSEAPFNETGAELAARVGQHL
ncbi:hypothetical protein [Actinocrispum wychmicini]|uniref:Uncharacterized protein n=1 Tax=Actinocrispum wychmicini TaxID=1213861 RepID=A0A4R2JYE1_9PSEU|nr:hypothetical protein [Actinocrispum wychmicini]TCO64894.1 hypothetical protein EV192_101678 [Actinocrispum wychmicini]